MPLRDLIPVRGPAGKQCHIAYAMTLLDGDDQATLADWLATDVAADFIAAAIRDETGFRLGAGTVRRHRRGDCLCGGH